MKLKITWINGNFKPETITINELFRRLKNDNPIPQ